MRLLATGERVAKGDHDAKVEIVGNPWDRFGLFRLPHRADLQFPTLRRIGTG
jgi:hypothetical protein